MRKPKLTCTARYGVVTGRLTGVDQRDEIVPVFVSGISNVCFGIEAEPHP